MEKVIVEKSGGIVHVRINRPEALNACEGDRSNAINDVLARTQADTELRLGIQNVR